MRLADLTDSAQNYLKALWTLSEWSKAAVTPSEVARHLGLRPSSVSDQIRRLTAQGLVDHAPYGSVTLTETGRTLALKMVRRHRLAETFLEQMLGYSWDEVHEDADLLEHAMTEKMLERIDAALGHPSVDPHGDPIPAPDGTMVRTAHVPLIEAAVGDSIVIARVRDADAGVLRYLKTNGLVPGHTFTVVDAGQTAGVVILTSEDGKTTVPISRDVAAYIRVIKPGQQPDSIGKAAVPSTSPKPHQVGQTALGQKA